MKKKLVLVLVALMLVTFVFAFASCGGNGETAPTTTSPLDGDDALAAYEYLSDKMNALGGFEATMVEESSYDGETSSMEMNVKLSLTDGKKGSIAMEEGGTLLDLTYIDGTVYYLMKMSGMTMKYKSTDPSMTAAFDILFAIFEDEEEDIASAEFVSRENGVYTLKVKATDEKALEKVTESYEDMGLDNPSFSDTSLTLTLICTAEGYVSSMTQTMSYKLDGEAYSEKSTITFKNVGTVPEITAPADADTYMNMDDME